jgi:hypothetical protein
MLTIASSSLVLRLERGLVCCRQRQAASSCAFRVAILVRIGFSLIRVKGELNARDTGSAGHLVCEL